MNPEQLQSQAEHLATVVMGWVLDTAAWWDMGQECDSPKFIGWHESWHPHSSWPQTGMVIEAFCTPDTRFQFRWDLELWSAVANYGAGYSVNVKFCMAACESIARATGWRGDDD